MTTTSPRERLGRSPSGPEILARMDRLPVTVIHIMWITLIAVNMMIDYFDNGLNIPLATELPRDPNAQTASHQVGTVLSIFYAGMVVGAILAGRLADRFGRRPVLFAFTVLYGAASLMTAALPTFDWLLISRFVTGVGVQGVTSILVMLMVEMFPSATRGRFVAASTIAFTVSAPILAGLACYILPNHDPGAWRWLFLLGGLGVILAPIVAKAVPESPRWLVAQGRLAEADAIVVRLEDAARRAGKELTEATVVTGSEVRYSLRSLLKNPKAFTAVAVVSIGWFGTTLGLYLNQNFSVEVLYVMYTDQGTPDEEALSSSYVAYLLQACVYVVTPVLTWFLIGRMERKTLILFASIASGLSIVAMAYGGVSMYTVGMVVSGVLTGVVFSVFYAYIPESVPTEFRGLGSGLIFGIGRAGAMVTGVLYTALYFPAAEGGMWGLGRSGVMMASAAAYLIAGTIVFLFGPRTAGRSLEAVAADEFTDAAVDGVCADGLAPAEPVAAGSVTRETTAG